jgi:hypothetical protein
MVGPDFPGSQKVKEVETLRKNMKCYYCFSIFHLQQTWANIQMPFYVSALGASPANSGLQSHAFGQVVLVYCGMSGFLERGLSFCQHASIA